MGTGRILDMLLGAMVMGTVGSLIGLFMGGGYLPVAVGLGVILGAGVGVFGGRRFFASILVGALAGALLGWGLGGVRVVTVGAASGAAMGGFLGVWISMMLDVLAQRRDQFSAPPSISQSPKNGEP